MPKCIPSGRTDDAHYGYTECPQHEQKHALFEQAIQGFTRNYGPTPIVVKYELLDFTLSWLTNHIRHEDVKLRQLRKG